MTSFNQSLQAAPATFRVLDGADAVWDREAMLAVVARCQADARAAGIGPGCRLGLMLPDHPMTPVVTLALMDLTQVLPINAALTPVEIATIVRNARLDALVLPVGVKVLFDAPCPILRLADGGLSGSVTFAGASGTTGLLMLTSGSTAEPKRVQLRFDQLLTSARQIAATLALTPADTALLALPMFHIGALVDLFLAPLVSGGAVFVCTDRSAQGLLGALRAGRCSWAQMVPTMLAQCLATWTDEDIQAVTQGLRFLRSVSSDLAAPVHLRAESRLGGLPIVQIYGLTETAGQVASNPLPPAIRRPGSVGVPVGVQVSIVDGQGSPVAQGQTGEICLRGPTVTIGYEDVDPSETFLAGWLRTGDLGRLDQDGFLWLEGRKKEIVNRGGEKIAVLEVERAALSVPGVQQAAAYALPHPTLGEQVGLSVVLEPGAVLGQAVLLAALRSALAEFKMPRSVTFLDSFPRLGSGKIDKRALAKTGAVAVAPGPVWTGLDAQIARLWQDTLKTRVPQAEDDFFDAGGDSLSSAEFLVALEDLVGHTLSHTILYEAPTFAALVAAVKAAPQHSAAPQALDTIDSFLRDATRGWSGRPVGSRGLIFALQTLAEATPVFYCSQGEVDAFRSIVGPDRPIYTCRTLYQLKGRTLAHSQELARRYADEINDLAPAGPLLLAGFCEGARIFEMAASQLIAAGRTVELFVSIDHWFAAPTPYPVLQAFTENRRLSGAARFKDHRRGYGHLHPAGVQEVFILGNHVHAMTERALAPLAAPLQNALRGVRLAMPPAPVGPSLDDRRAAWRADIRLSGPHWLTRDSARMMRVQVTNTSDRTWPPYAEGGPALALHLCNLDGFRRISHAAHVPLASPVAPGATVKFKVPVTFPGTGLPLIATAQMVDEGLAEFGGKGPYGASRLVWANPFSAKHWKD